ncbi:hypothetical protein CUR178_06461 [Leishmania enriettii]|uniref:Uncharacterized protein n=1 Tax=Leishmania enriettii TaxID=5663 RepID=A0A836GW50_LEIEN|nr:hypothetical protein CUR178_06461 [Leishmania enriettii]
MLRRTFFRCCRLGAMRPPGPKGPNRRSSSAPYTIGGKNHDCCADRRVHVALPLLALVASSIPAASNKVSCAWLRGRDAVSLTSTGSVACQRRSISFSYCSSVPCVRFDVSTERLARATAQPTLPASANIFMIDVRKSHRKSKRVNPKSAMSSVITAHRAEAQKAKEELNKDDAYTPPLIFLFKTDDTKKQAERRQEQMDAQLDALGAFGEFRVCVLDGIKSRQWTRYIDPPTVKEKAAPGQAEAASSGGAPDTTSAPSVIGAALDPTIAYASGTGDAPASPFPPARAVAVGRGASPPDAPEASAAAVSPRLSAGGAAAEAGKQADGVEGDDEVEWEEVEIEEFEEEVEGDDSVGGRSSVGADHDAGAAALCEAHTCEGGSAVLATPTDTAATIAHAEAHEKKGITAPSTAKKSVNPVWAHVTSKVQGGDSVAGATSPVAATEVSPRDREDADEEAVDVEDLDCGDVATNATSPAVPNLAANATNKQQSLPERTSKASSVDIPNASQWSAPDRNRCDNVFLATAHAPPSAEVAVEAAPLKRSTGAEALTSLEELEEFDIDALLGETADADTPAEAAVSASADGVPGAWSTMTTEEAEPAAAEHVAAASVACDDGFTAVREDEVREAEEAARSGSATAFSSRTAEAAAAARCLTEVTKEDVMACAAAGAAGEGPASTACDRDSAESKVQEKDSEKEAETTTDAEDCSSSPSLTVTTPPPPVRPPKPSTPMPVYPQVPSRLYYGATTVYLSDRAYVELPATANVLVIDQLDWDDAHLAAIDAALEQVDPVAGHVLLYPGAYAPQSEHVMGDMNAYRRSLLPFIFVFRTQLSAEIAMAVQRRLTNALHVRPTLGSNAQQSLVIGQNDRTSVCVLSAAESEKGGENPMLAPQSRKAAPASTESSPVKPAAVRHATVAGAVAAPRHEVDAPIRKQSTTTAASAPASALPQTPSAVMQAEQRGGCTESEAGDAVQHLRNILSRISSDASSERKAAVEVQPQISVLGASSVRGSTDRAQPACTCPAESSDARMTGTGDSGEASREHVAASTVGGDAEPSQPPRLAYASSRLSPEAAAPFFYARAGVDAAGGVAAVRSELPKATLPDEEHGSAAMIKRGLFHFGAIAFGKDNGYYKAAEAAVPRRRQAPGPGWGEKDAGDEVDDELNAACAADGAATSSALGNVSDLGLYPVSESVAAARAEAARNSSQGGGGSPFSDEEIAKIEEEIILAQFKKMERKEKRIEARRAMREKAKEANASLSCRSSTVLSPSPPCVPSVSSSTKRSRTLQKRWRGIRNASDSSKATATPREQELAEDKLLEDFISGLLVSNIRSKRPKVKATVSIPSAPSRGLGHSASRTLVKADSSTRERRQR